MYKLNLFEADTDGKRSLLTPKEIQSILQFIVNDADEKSSQTEFFNPGVFTTANRTTWATVRFFPLYVKPLYLRSVYSI